MKAFQEKVAVVTGAASGIGRALAERCAKEGMKVVLADIEEQALLQTSQQALRNGMPPQHVADSVFEAIREERFSILPAPEWKGAIESRMEDILQKRNPTLPKAPNSISPGRRTVEP